jgi:hypothetical protein
MVPLVGLAIVALRKFAIWAWDVLTDRSLRSEPHPGWSGGDNLPPPTIRSSREKKAPAEATAEEKTLRDTLRKVEALSAKAATAGERAAASAAADRIRRRLELMAKREMRFDDFDEIVPPFDPTIDPHIPWYRR